MYEVRQVRMSPRAGTLYAGFPTKTAAKAAADTLPVQPEMPSRFAALAPTIHEVPDGSVPLFRSDRPDGWFFEYDTAN